MIAVIDTGATHTVINQGLLTEAVFGPPAGGVLGADFIGQHHEIVHREVRLYLGETKLEMHIGEWPLGGNQHPKALIGRDILNHGGLVYDSESHRWKLWYIG